MSDGVSFISEWGLGKLSRAERGLCEAFARGGEVDLRTGDPEKDDPQHGDKWGGARRVRAEVIAALLLSDVRAAPGRVAAVRLRGARVTGALSLADAEVRFPLLLEECWFEQPICLDEAAVRTVSLAGSVIPGLDANDTKVDGHLWLHACSMQRVALTDARIGGQLTFDGARLANPGGPALNCGEVEAGSLWLKAEFAADGEVDLSGARVGTLYDDPACWPASLNVNELVYNDLEPDLPARRRLRWLRRGGKEYRAQPYEQLAAYYRRQGHDEQARRVLLAKHRYYRRSHPWYARIFGYLLDVMVGYGYRPGWAALWMLALLVAGSVFFIHHRPEPIKPGEHPHYQPVLYAADVLLPIIDLGQESAFKHQGLAQWVASALILLGWLFATAVATGVTRVLTRN